MCKRHRGLSLFAVFFFFLTLSCRVHNGHLSDNVKARGTSENQISLKKKISSLRNPLTPPSQRETFDENDFRKNRLTLVSQTS